VRSLSKLLSKYAEQGDDALRQAADEVADQGHLAEYLRDLLNGTATDSDSYPVGYRHPNGFTKIRLCALPAEGWAIRLHLWDPGSADGDVHSHRWHFASRVLSGELIEETYQLTPGAGTWAMFSCAPSTAGQYALTPAGSCAVRLMDRLHHRAGETYFRALSEFHVARAAADSPAVTLFVQGTAQASRTTVAGRTGPEVRASRLSSVPLLTRAEVSDRLRQVATIMSAL
jgi:hypothetical protein